MNQQNNQNNQRGDFQQTPGTCFRKWVLEMSKIYYHYLFMINFYFSPCQVMFYKQLR